MQRSKQLEQRSKQLMQRSKQLIQRSKQQWSGGGASVPARGVRDWPERTPPFASPMPEGNCAASGVHRFGSFGLSAGSKSPSKRTLVLAPHPENPFRRGGSRQQDAATTAPTSSKKAALDYHGVFLRPLWNQ